jgi:hypothetical protein
MVLANFKRESRVGLARTIYTVYMTIYSVISLPIILYIHRIYIYIYIYIWFWPTLSVSHVPGWPEPYIHTYHIHGVLAGKSANKRSYTVYTYGSGQPYSIIDPIYCHPSPSSIAPPVVRLPVRVKPLFMAPVPGRKAPKEGYQ